MVITEKKKEYSLHHETIRWRCKLKAMYLRHEELVKEMDNRGYEHKSPLDKRKATGKSKQDFFVDIPSKQIQILKQKGCTCQDGDKEITMIRMLTYHSSELLTHISKLSN